MAAEVAASAAVPPPPPPSAPPPSVPSAADNAAAMAAAFVAAASAGQNGAGSSGGAASRVLQVTNIAPQATRDQMLCLFNALSNTVEDLRLYPTIRDASVMISSRVAFVKFKDASTVAAAQHLNNTVFIDRAIIISIVAGGHVPDETEGLQLAAAAAASAGGSNGQKESAAAKLPPGVVNRMEGELNKGIDCFVLRCYV